LRRQRAENVRRQRREQAIAEFGHGRPHIDGERGDVPEPSR
jgi:hypothetical protein